MENVRRELAFEIQGNTKFKNLDFHSPSAAPHAIPPDGGKLRNEFAPNGLHADETFDSNHSTSFLQSAPASRFEAILPVLEPEERALPLQP